MNNSSPSSFAAPLAAPLPARQWRRLRQHHVLAVLVLAACLAVTFQLWRNSTEHAHKEMQSTFDFSVLEAGARIEQRMAAYEQVLQSAKSFLSHAKLMNRTEFHSFIDKLHIDDHYPGIQAVSFAQLVPGAQKELHLAAIRSEGFPDYAIHPGGTREWLAPVVYVEPFFGANLRAFGHDPYADAVRRAAMDQARDFDLPVITGKVTLAQETGKNIQVGFLMYLPVFKFDKPHASVAERRDALLGWVGAPFRINDLMDGLHGEHAAELDIELFDGEQVSARTLMYDPNHDHDDARSALAMFQAERRIRIANRTWTMQIHSRPGFDARLDRNSPRLVAFSGLGIGLLLSLLTLVLAGSRQRALLAARVMNGELIERETRYRQMFQNNTSIAYLVEPDSGRIVDANAAAAAFTGYTQEQLRTMNIADINIASREHIMAAMHQVGDGKRIHMEWHHRLKNGDIRDVEVFSGPLDYQGQVLLYSIVHDISARKQAEQALLESEARAREITATIGEGVIVTDSHGIITYINPEAKSLLGWSDSVMLGMNGHSLLHHSRPDGSRFPAQECPLNQVLESGQPFRSHDEAFWRKDGSMLPVFVNVAPIIHGRQVIGSVVAFHDTIGRKKAQQARADESIMNAQLLRSASDGICVLDPDGKVVLANDAFCKMLDYTADQMKAMTMAEWDTQCPQRQLQEKFGHSLPRDGLFETRYRRRDGTLLDVEVHAATVLIGAQPLLYAAIRDITQRKAVGKKVRAAPVSAN